MSNIKSDTSKITFNDLYVSQMCNQKDMLRRGCYKGFTTQESYILPHDDVKLFSFHMQQLMSEIGEVLQSDKRWKNMRNDGYDKTHKTEEIADCFIVLMNTAMFSGISSEEMVTAILDKLDVISERIEEL